MEFEYQELAPSRRRAACNFKAEDHTRAGYSDIMMNRGRLRRARVVESIKGTTVGSTRRCSLRECHHRRGVLVRH
jgi:hypothetical protein